MAGGTHLELEERERLAAPEAEGLSLRAIARQLARAASTISRELRRNALPKGGYRPVHAEGCHLEGRQRPAVLERAERLGRFAPRGLLEGWTPEQIAGWLERGEARGPRPVSLETIYAFIHRPRQKGEKLWQLLPRGRARRGRRRARPPRSTIAGRRSIHDRPADVQERKDPGHWEGDLLICRRTRPVLVLKERKTRLVLAARLAGKSAAETVAGLMAGFRGVRPRRDPRLRTSIPFDNDTAFARHGLLASACSMATWFCDAYASWQKGAVENANGRLRRALPRDLDLDALGDAELRDIVLSHNLTPRKCLGFLTPLQALLKELGRDVQIRFAEPVALRPSIRPRPDAGLHRSGTRPGPRQPGAVAVARDAHGRADPGGPGAAFARGRSVRPHARDRAKIGPANRSPHRAADTRRCRGRLSQQPGRQHAHHATADPARRQDRLPVNFRSLPQPSAANARRAA